jgi:hypothetical protein
MISAAPHYMRFPQVHVPDHRELQPLQRSGCPPLPPSDQSRDVTFLGDYGR